MEVRLGPIESLHVFCYSQWSAILVDVRLEPIESPHVFCYNQYWHRSPRSRFKCSRNISYMPEKANDSLRECLQFGVISCQDSLELLVTCREA